MVWTMFEQEWTNHMTSSLLVQYCKPSPQTKIFGKFTIILICNTISVGRGGLPVSNIEIIDFFPCFKVAL